ncbi:MAG: Rieske 2Fe-2S domain-containing protein [Pirellulaceae bacterium]
MSHATHTPPPGDDRRSFMTKAAAVVIGGFVAIVPLGAGLATFLDPIFRKSKVGSSLKVASLDALPADGVPRRFPVIDDMVDAWNRYPAQPVGAVYLRRMPESDEVHAFNAICPHAGCFVDFNTAAGDEGLFQCPCHDSNFMPDGARYQPEKCASPRDLDSLEVDAEKLAAGEIWVEFKNFLAGHAEKEPIA